jgi:uncharacterized protein YqiB (DUF1249 family)
MFADSLLLPYCVFRPGSFSGLMLLYESNYCKLLELTGGIGPVRTRWISRVRDQNDLHLEWLGAEPYTSTLRMTYWLRSGVGPATPAPNLSVRIYRDAGQAEAVAEDAGTRRPAAPGSSSVPGRELALRWQRNMMFNKWLDYLIDSRHGFT